MSATQIFWGWAGRDWGGELGPHGMEGLRRAVKNEQKKKRCL